MSTVVDHVARADMTNVGVERAMTAEVRNGMPAGMANSDVPEIMPAAVPGGMAGTDVTTTVTTSMPATVTTSMASTVTTVLSDRWETQQTDHGDSDNRGYARACLQSHAHVWPPIITPASTAEAPTKSAGAYIYIDTAQQQIFPPGVGAISDISHLTFARLHRRAFRTRVQRSPSETQVVVACFCPESTVTG